MNQYLRGWSAKLYMIMKQAKNTRNTYADEPAVPKFQQDGQAFRAWRSLVWASCYAIMDDVLNGKRQTPTETDLIAELPAINL